MIENMLFHNLPTIAATIAVGAVLLVLIKVLSPKTGLISGAVLVAVLLGVLALIAYTAGWNIYRWNRPPADLANQSDPAPPSFGEQPAATEPDRINTGTQYPN